MTQIAPDAPAEAVPDPEPTEGAELDPTPQRPRPFWRRWLRSPNLIAAVIYVLTAGLVTERVWFYLNTYIMAGNPQDQTFFEWALANAVRVVVGGHDPFFTDMLNMPDGVNMMANTSAYGLTIPLIPVTMLFGPHVSFAVMVTFSLAATAFTWYWFFRRHVVSSWLGAFVGGAFCGFAPGMISQANAHPNISAQFVLPLILSWVLRLREPGRVVRNGIILGLLIVYQAFLNEELLFVLALCCGLVIGVWALHRRSEAKQAARYLFAGLGVAAAVAGTLLAYPLYVQFAGRQAYHGLWAGAKYFGADLLSFTSFSAASLSGDPVAAKLVSQNSAEQNSFFGWPLVAFCVLVTVLMWRHVVVRSVAVLALVFGPLSLGPVLLVHGSRHMHVWTPYQLLYKFPIFDSVITTRLALVLIPVVGTLLALVVDHVRAYRSTTRQQHLVRILAAAVVVAVLLPLAPTRLAIVARSANPEFITNGHWRAYVQPGRTLVPVPLPTFANYAMDGMQWASTQQAGFALPAGYFLGPDPSKPNRVGMFSAPMRPSNQILADVLKTGNIPAITDKNRQQMVVDLKFWRAAILVLAPKRHNAEALRQTASDLLGFQPTLIDGAWVWDVRSLVG
jgi:hypothetical protein